MDMNRKSYWTNSIVNETENKSIQYSGRIL